MPRKEIVDYIENQLKKGQHINNIKAELTSIGHKIEDVEKAIAHLYKRKAILKILFVSLFLFLVAVGMFYFQGIGKEAGEAEEVLREGGVEEEIEIPAEAALGEGEIILPQDLGNETEVPLEEKVEEDTGIPEFISIGEIEAVD